MALFSSGSNAKGQLGSGDAHDRHQFHRCSFDGCEDTSDLPREIVSIIQIASGSNHTLLLAECADDLLGRNRSLWVTGDGSRGQLGLSNRGCQIFHKLDVTLGNSVLQGYTPVSIAACWETSFVVLRPPEWKHSTSDAVIAMGANDFGDLGVSANVAMSVPMGTPHILSFAQAIRAQRSNHELRSEYFRIRRLEASLHHVIVILDIFHTNDSTSVRQCLIGWGASRHGQLQFQPAVEINSSNTAPRRQNGTQAFLPVPTSCQFQDNRPITSFALGQQHSVLLSGDSIFAAGSNKKGQLNLDAVIRGALSVHCTWNGTYVICRPSDTDWQIQATGSGNKGQLGMSSAPPSSAAASSSSSTVPQGGLRNVSFSFPAGTKQLQSIACGSEHVLVALSSDEGSEVWGWGWNEHGNLGLGHTNDVNVPIKIWPESDTPTPPGVVVRAWAGCGTSWIFVK